MPGAQSCQLLGTFFALNLLSWESPLATNKALSASSSMQIGFFRQCNPCMHVSWQLIVQACLWWQEATGSKPAVIQIEGIWDGAAGSEWQPANTASEDRADHDSSGYCASQLAAGKRRMHNWGSCLDTESKDAGSQDERGCMSLGCRQTVLAKRRPHLCEPEIHFTITKKPCAEAAVDSGLRQDPQQLADSVVGKEQEAVAQLGPSVSVEPPLAQENEQLRAQVDELLLLAENEAAEASRLRDEVILVKMQLARERLRLQTMQRVMSRRQALPSSQVKM